MQHSIYREIDNDKVFDLKDSDTNHIDEGLTKEGIKDIVINNKGTYQVKHHYDNKPWKKLDEDTFFEGINSEQKNEDLDFKANPTTINISEKSEIKKYPFAWKDNTGKVNTTSLTLDELKEFIIDKGINKEDVRVSEKGKPSKNDWTTPDEIPEIKNIFDSIQNTENNDLGFDTPDF
ncbi:hypothetical protein JEZ13_02105, partial [bacterium]|nr:hypothetical protein [bacterium]